MSSDFKNVQSAIDSVLNVKSIVRRKRKSEQNKKKELFVNMINGIELAIIRSHVAFTDFGIDYSVYDETYMEIIDSLIYAHYGKDVAELISYYLWDRVNPDGSVNAILDEDDNEIVLKDTQQLWDLVCKLNPKI